MTTTPPQRSELIALISGSLERLLAPNNQVTFYSSGSELPWRELEGGELPSARFGLRAALVGDLLYVFGGYGGEKDNPERLLSSILYWDQVALTWQEAGHLSKPRAFSAVVSIPSSVILDFCKTK